MPKDIIETREMKINEIDLANVTDGTYQGAYSYAGSDYLVEVAVKEHKIEKIDILEAFTGTPHSRKARAIIDTVIAYQSLDVDVITGATTTSKAYLKCIENALDKGVVE
jgi:uncharacterized protein with FMN-binding domain